MDDRTYDPTTGTFLSPDPLDGQPGTPDEANPYDYVGNDPLDFLDPLGLCRITDAEFDADGNITGGTYVYEQNTQACEATRNKAGTNTSLCGGNDWKGVYFYDWDPYNTVNWDTDGGCTVTQANGENFGVSWEVGPCEIGGWRQGVADFAGGTWSVVSLGFGTGLGDSRTCGSSGLYTTGNALGLLLLGGAPGIGSGGNVAARVLNRGAAVGGYLIPYHFAQAVQGDRSVACLSVEVASAGYGSGMNRLTTSHIDETGVVGSTIAADTALFSSLFTCDRG